jgi:hypothetical protein
MSQTMRSGTKATVERQHLSGCLKLLIAECIVVLYVINNLLYKVGISAIIFFTMKC